MVAIIDYDAGNIKSVEKALRFLGQEVQVTRPGADTPCGQGDSAGGRSLRGRYEEALPVWFN